MVKIELVYVGEDGEVFQQTLALKQGTTLGQALGESSLVQTHPDTKTMPVGIYGKPMPLETILQEGDRVEIYRPLASDPKEKRRKLARSRKR